MRIWDFLLFINLFYVRQIDCDLSRSLHSGLRLNDFIKHFEPLYYDREAFRNENSRLKRSVFDNSKHEPSVFYFNFSSHRRDFTLRLKHDHSIFVSDIEFDSTDGRVDYDTSRILVGHLEGDEDSTVHGIFTKDGLFDGTIVTPSDEFYIEPADRYFPKTNEFHSVIYKVSDIIPFNHSESCRSHLLHKFHQNSESDGASNTQSATEDTPKLDNYVSNFRTYHKSEKYLKFGYHRRLNYSIPSSLFSGNLYRPNYNNSLRTKRSHSPKIREHSSSIKTTLRMHWMEEHAKKRTAIDPKKTTCMLYLQADHLFYQRMGSVEACIEQMTRHVQKVNNIYRVADFDQDGVQDNIVFMIKRIKVHNTKALKDPKYRFPNNYGVEKFLELFSEEDYDSFCLAYMFTYRDFEGGTLGLAWTGDLKNAGGVCEKNGHYRGSLKSLNTGIVTLLNYGKHVPPAVSHVTLAHEIGHNFGSPHDPEDDQGCTPGGPDGNYIMFARATSGDKYNNQKFSPCSLRSISSVLNTKARGSKGCFTEPQDSICGNEVVELGEECDCGWEEDCKEPCCFPMRSNPPRNEPPCTLRPNVICSPSQGPCCTRNCKLAYGNKCREDNGCRSSSSCDGTGPKCPPSIHKPNRTICNGEFVCYMGECTGSICIAYGLEFCQCQRGPLDPVTKACELCCKLPGQDHTCKSSFDWNSPPYMLPDMFAKPGTPCENYNGYCDVFQKCREVDPSGPLATLRRLLLSNESMKSLKDWVIQHWWGVLLLASGFIIFLVLVVRIFGKKPERTKQVDTCSEIPLAGARSSVYHQGILNAECHPRQHNPRRSNTNRSLTAALARQSGSHMSVITALSPRESTTSAIFNPRDLKRGRKWV